jgi:hypothetical protein
MSMLLPREKSGVPTSSTAAPMLVTPGIRSWIFAMPRIPPGTDWSGPVRVMPSLASTNPRPPSRRPRPPCRLVPGFRVTTVLPSLNDPPYPIEVMQVVVVAPDAGSLTTPTGQYVNGAGNAVAAVAGAADAAAARPRRR